MSLDRDTEAEGGGSPHFVELYRVEYPGMVRLAHALTGSAEAAEDVVQEAFARLHGRTVLLENPGGYLRTTVVNLCRDRDRRGRREKNLPSRLPSDVALSLGASELMDVLLRLPYRERAVLVMRYWGDWTERQIADALKCRPGTVKSLASRGLAHLKKEVSP
jgi:RNA polymerase sigma factor (sigma-70 family)